MIVTINTDASFHPEHKVAAFSCWIVCNQGKILRAGPLKKAKDSSDAETQGIANALHLLHCSEFTGITKVIINNDCKYAHQEILTGSSKAAKHCKAAAAKIRSVLRKIADQHSLPTDWKRWVEFRYVPAHTGTESARKWVNDWCDNAAKEQMRKQIK